MMNTKHKQLGVTLIELTIVLVIISMLSVMLGPKFKNYLEGTDARLIKEMSTQLNDIARENNTSMRVGASMTASRLLRPGNSYLDIIVHGERYVADAEAANYSTSGQRVLGRIKTINSPVVGTAGTYRVESLPIRIVPGTTTHNAIEWSRVSSKALEILLKNESEKKSADFRPSTAVNTGAIIYGAADTNGEHVVTMFLER